MDKMGHEIKRCLRRLPVAASGLGVQVHTLLEGFIDANRPRFRSWHSWFNDELWLILQLTGGSGWVEIERCARQELRPGDLLWLPPGHQLRYGPSVASLWRESILVCGGPTLDGWVAAGLLPQEAIVLQVAIDDLIADALDACTEGQYQRCVPLACAVFHRVSLAQHDHDSPTRGHPVVELAQRIRSKPGHSWNMDDLAVELRIGREGLRKAFVRHLGLPPVRLIRHERLELAKQYLLDGMSVLETAQRCGYSDVSWFSRHFHRHVGIPPSRFRDQAASRIRESSDS